MAKILYNKPSVYRAEGVQLFPGMNVIPDDQLSKFLENPGVKDRITKGIISIETIEQSDEIDSGAEKTKGRK